MKTTTAGVLAFAAFAAAQLPDDFDIPDCAMTCFTQTVTDYPPLECKEPTMFHCFCKDPFGPDLQRHWADCIFEACATRQLIEDSVFFGKELCASEFGSPITVSIVYPWETTSTAAEESSTAAPEETSTTAAPEESTTSAADEEETTVTSATLPATETSTGAPATETSSSSAPAEQTSTSGSVSQPLTTVTKEVSFTTSVCEDSTKPVVTVTSSHWECPHGCNGTVTSIHKPKPNPSQPGKPDGHHSEDNAHGTPSQSAPKPTGTGSGSEPSETTPVIVNMGNSATVSSLLAAAGVAVAVFRLL